MSAEKSPSSLADLYKTTVFLPKTEFPMRGELPKKEPEILAKWQEEGLYGKIRAASKGRKKWVLHWGPPYANGNIHIGHAFTKSLKDVVNRYHQMTGYDAHLVPGWDCHGLPIEWKIEEQYREQGKDKAGVDPLAFRAECRAFARHWVEVQGEEMVRLGVSADWGNPYLTMTHEAEATIAAEIHKFLRNGLLYRGVKPVMWSTVEKTALAEAEIEYHDHKSTAIWVKFPVREGQFYTDEGSNKVCDLKGASIVIWTTTPWTIPGNRAIAFGQGIQYGLFRVTKWKEPSEGKPVGERLIVALSLAESLKHKAGVEEWSKEQDFRGLNLIEGIVCDHPLKDQGRYDFEVPLLDADFVAEDTGTGFVHIAPGHGQDDYNLVRNSPDRIAVQIETSIDDEGYYTDKHPAFAGKQVFANELFKAPERDANIAVLKALAGAGALLAKESFRHDYPHSWRSKAPVVFRVTPQWFIAMDRAADGEKETLRHKALSAISNSSWFPAQGQNRIRAMVEGRPDWCISRQRAWGVPIAIFVEKKTGMPLREKAVLDRIVEIFRREGSDAWWKRPASDFLGPDRKPEDFEQVFDIVDVWFESGATHAFVLEGNPDLTWPADLYLEGSDQHRGWFQSSLLESCGTRGVAPFKNVLTHGFILDEKGYKMSKSMGNVVAPEEVWNKYGADILRLWAITVDYTEDVPIGDGILKATADIYRRIRNTFRYLLGALDGFTEGEKIDLNDPRVPELERLVLHWIAEKDNQIRAHIGTFDFGKIASLIHSFCNIELSSFYFDIRKDRLYCDRSDLFERRAARTVMAHLFEALVTWLAPILPFTCEEAWGHRPPDVFGATQSLHLRVFPDVPESWKNPALAEKWAAAALIRKVVLGALELKRTAKTIGSSLEAAPEIYVSNVFEECCPSTKGKLTALQSLDWAEICITSGASFADRYDTDDTFSLREVPGVHVRFKDSGGDKCARCWKVLPDVGTDADHPGVCPRCADAVRAYAADQKAA